MVSPGCSHCYAMVQAARFSGPGMPFEGFVRRRGKGHLPVWTDKFSVLPENLADPVSWQKPERIFVNSMSDLWHDGTPELFIRAVFATVAVTGRHTYQFLTKRADRMEEFTRSLTDANAHEALLEAARAYGVRRVVEALEASTGRVSWPLGNAEMGVSAETQEWADARLPHLARTVARRRFVSLEPLLGPVSIARWLPGGADVSACEVCHAPQAVGELAPVCDACGALLPKPVDVAIIGGESGWKARVCEIEWIQALVAELQAADTAPFVKQVGARPSINRVMLRLESRKGGDPYEWPDDIQVREWPGAYTSLREVYEADGE